MIPRTDTVLLDFDTGDNDRDLTNKQIALNFIMDREMTGWSVRFITPTRMWDFGGKTFVEEILVVFERDSA
jgi:hypothetical protein